MVYYNSSKKYDALASLSETLRHVTINLTERVY
jgi:hypothetical protein